MKEFSDVPSTKSQKLSHNAVPFFGKVTAKKTINQIQKNEVVSKGGVKTQKLRKMQKFINIYAKLL